MPNNKSQTAYQKPIENLSEYIFLKEVRANTSLINGQIFYDGKYWTEELYNSTFPEAVIRYKSVEQLDGTQIEK